MADLETRSLMLVVACSLAVAGCAAPPGWTWKPPEQTKETEQTEVDTEQIVDILAGSALVSVFQTDVEKAVESLRVVKQAVDDRTLVVVGYETMRCETARHMAMRTKSPEWEAIEKLVCCDFCEYQAYESTSPKPGTGE